MDESQTSIKENAVEEMLEETKRVYLPFPSIAEINARFRRLMIICQRSSKLTAQREEQKIKKNQRIEQLQAVMHERELKRLEEKQKYAF